MPSYTDNLGLVTWNPDDFWNASDYNENMEKLDDNAGNNDSNMAYVAVKSGNNWQLPSGKNAAIGEFIVLNGILGHATAAITGGSTNIASGTNWTPETKGGLNALNQAIGTLSNLTTTAKTNLVAAVNEVDGDVTTLSNRLNIKKAPFNIPTTTLGSLSPTAVSVGQVSTLCGVPGLTQDNVIGIFCNQTSLTPASNIVCGLFSNAVYIAATQSCTVGSNTGINGTVWYYE